MVVYQSCSFHTIWLPLPVFTQYFVYQILPSGNVEAVALRDIYIRATGKMPLTQALRQKDLGWEGLKKTNSSSLIHIYRYAPVAGTLLWFHATKASLLNSKLLICWYEGDTDTKHEK